VSKIHLLRFVVDLLYNIIQQAVRQITQQIEVVEFWPKHNCLSLPALYIWINTSRGWIHSTVQVWPITKA